MNNLNLKDLIEVVGDVSIVIERLYKTLTLKQWKDLFINAYGFEMSMLILEKMIIANDYFSSSISHGIYAKSDKALKKII